MKKHVVAYARDCWFRFDFRFVVLACCDVEETSDGKEPLSVKDGIPRNRSSESAVPTQHRSALSCRAGKTKRTALRESIVANVPAPFQCRLERTKPRERERERERERSVLVFFSLKGEKNPHERERYFHNLSLQACSAPSFDRDAAMTSSCFLFARCCCC